MYLLAYRCLGWHGTLWRVRRSTSHKLPRPSKRESETTMTTIQADIRLQLHVPGDANLPVSAEFAYSTDDPMAIHATFHTAGDTVEWVFSRDILDAGLSGDSGIGDIRIWPSRGWDSVDQVEIKIIYIALNSPEGAATLEVEAAAMKAFLDQTYELVPTGAEFIDMDTLLADLLS